MKNIPDLHDWQKMKAIHPLLPHIVREVLRHVPATQTLVLYGSQVTKDTDAYSDYDVLIITPAEKVPDFDERAAIEKNLAQQYGIRTQVMATSPSALWLELRLNPYVRHWIEHGIIVGDNTVFSDPLPPLAKEGARVSLGSIETDLELMTEESNGRRSQAEVLYRALRMLLLLRAAICGNYSFDVREEAEKRLGTTLVRRLRNPKGRLSTHDLTRLKQEVQTLLKEVRALVNLMPENTSDEELRRHVWIYKQEAV